MSRTIGTRGAFAVMDPFAQNASDEKTSLKSIDYRKFIQHIH